MSQYNELGIEVDDKEIDSLINDVDNESVDSLIDDTNYDNNYSNLKYNPNQNNSKKRVFNFLIKLIIALAVIFGIVHIIKQFGSSSDSHEVKEEKLDVIIDPVTGYRFTKGSPREDKFGLDLNKYILDGMYNVGVDNIPIKEIEDWSLYIPYCPNLQPINHAEAIINPDCENTSLQFVNLSNNTGKGYPYILPLHQISEQIKKFEEWKGKGEADPKYEEQDISKLLDDSYHPYNYGFDVSNDPETGITGVNRRLFSFISFDFEFDLLDIYLAENYDIVDYFVIFESNSTLVGDPKPLYFTRTLLETKRYEHFMDKLIPVPYIMPAGPENKDGTLDNVIYNYMIENGLRAVNARHGDLFVYGKVGEIPKHHVLSRLKNCGGWEHLYSGIGDSSSSSSTPIDIRDDQSSKKLPKEKPLAFSSWGFQYAIKYIEDNELGTEIHPHLAIFDTRRSSDNDDPYKSYGDFNLSTNDELPNTKNALLWSAGWDMSRFYPTVDHIYNKLLSLSEEYKKEDPFKAKYDIKTKLDNKKNIFDKKEKSYVENIIHKTPPIGGFPYNFEVKHLLDIMANPEDNRKADEYEIYQHEIPQQLGRNSICYSYMFEREFGVSKPLWYDTFPKEQLKTVNLTNIDYNTVGKYIGPWACPGKLEDLHIMSSEDTIRDIIKNRKSITRFGDGEYSMVVRNHIRSGFQPENEELSKKLKEIMFSNEDRLLIGVPDNLKAEFNKLSIYSSFWSRYINNFEFQLVDVHNVNKLYGSSMMSRFYVPKVDQSHVPEYIKLFQGIWEGREVLLVEGELTRFGGGNDFLDNAKSVERILGPAKDAFAVYDKLYAEVLKHDKSKLVLLSLGQTATVLSYDLYKAGYQAIDIGHADIEYEWYLHKSGHERINIPGKFCNECGGYKGEFHDDRYEKQIVARITHDDDSNNKKGKSGKKEKRGLLEDSEEYDYIFSK